MKKPKRKKIVSDHELIKNYLKTNNPEKFRILYNKHKDYVIKIVKPFAKEKNLIKDYSQDVWNKLVMNLHKFKGTEFRAWLATMTRNHCIDRIRKSKTKPPPLYIPNLINSIECDGHNVSHIKEREKILDFIMEEIEKFHPTQRDVVKLRLQGKDYEEISKILNKPIGTCQPAFKTALEKLKKIVIPKFNETIE